MNFDKPFWKTVLREADGTASASRLLSAAVIGASLLWVSYLVVKNKHLPELGMVAEFDTATVAALYGVNRVMNTVQTVLTSKATTN